MALVHLSDAERQGLQQIVRHAGDAKLVKRAQVLLWLDQGDAPSTVASRQAVSRQTLYNWVHGFQETSGEPLQDRLQERPRSGRPAVKGPAVAELIEEVKALDPRQFGYTSPVWTTALLRRHLKREKHLVVCARTVRRALRQEEYRYKRPRYVLSRRAATWRQVKGGSSGVCAGAGGP